MDATTALLVQGCACAPTAHPAVTAAAAGTSAVNPNAGAPVTCDATPCVEFDTVLAQMAGQLQTPEPRHGAKPTVSTESPKRNGHGARAIRADAEVDTQPAGDDDDDDGDGDEDADGPGSAALRQMTMMPAGPTVTTPIQTHTMRRSTRRVEGVWSGPVADEVLAPPDELTATPAEELMTAEEGRASQPDGAQTAIDQMNGSTVGQGGRAAGGPPADKAPVRESLTVRTAPQVGSRNVHVPAWGGRDEPARTDSPRPMGMPTTEPGMAPRVQKRTVAAVQERETAWPEGRTVVFPDTRGTAERDGNARVAPERLTMAATEEPMTTEPEQLAEAWPMKAQSTDGQGSMSQQPGDRKSASMDASASQPEDAQAAMDQTDDSAVGQGGHAMDGTPAERTPVRESGTVSAERPVGNTGRTYGHVEPKNMHTSAWVGRDEPARDGSRRQTGMSTTEPGMASRVQERTVAAMEERSASRPEGQTIALPDMRGTADPDESARTAPERLTMAATEEPMTMESEQPIEARSSDGQGRASQQPRDRKLAAADARTSQPGDARAAMDQTDDSAVGQGGHAMDGTSAERTPVRESVTVSTERPVGDTGRTDGHVEPKNMPTSAWVGRDESARDGSPRPMDMPTMEPGLAPRVQERTVAAMEERSASRPEGQTIALPDMRGTADPDESARTAPERLTMAATEEPMTMESEQPIEARSSDGQGRVSQQPRDRKFAAVDARTSQPGDAQAVMDQTDGSAVGQGGHAMDGTPAERTPVRESVTVSTKRPVGDTGRTDGHAEPKNANTPARVGRDESARDGSRRQTGMSTTEPSMAPKTVDIAHGKVAKAEIAESRQTALRPTAPRSEGAMTASRAVTVSQDWPEILVRSALVESLARHRNLPNPLWDEGLQRAGRRESEPNARPELAVVVGPTRTNAPAETPDVSQTPQAGRPALAEPAGSSVTRQIAAHVSARAAQGGGEFRARLIPEHLGSVQIRVRVVRGVCTADIRADDAEVARYIESHSSDLKVSLAEHGIDLSGLSVSSRSRAQEGWSAATLSHSEPDWFAPNWDGANARQQYAAAAFAGGNWRDGRGERRGALIESGASMGNSRGTVRQSSSPSPDEPLAARWVRGYARIDYLA